MAPTTGVLALQNSPIHFFFCASLPIARMAAAARPVPVIATAIPAQPQCNSSAISMLEMMSRPPPPYASGITATGVRPTSWAFFRTGQGNSSVSSECGATGLISFSANSWASALISSCSGVRVKSSGMGIAPLWREFGLGHTFVHDALSALVGHDQVDDDATSLIILGCHAAGAGDVVARQNHAGKAPLQPLQQRPVAQPVGDHLVGERHRQHPMGDDAGEPGRPREALVQVDRIAVPRCLCVLADLFNRHMLGERRQRLPDGDLFEVLCGHGLHGLLMMKSAVPPDTGWSCASLAVNSNVTRSMSPRLLIDVNRPVVVMRSPGRTGRSNVKLCSPCTRWATSNATSWSVHSCQ